MLSMSSGPKDLFFGFYMKGPSTVQTVHVYIFFYRLKLQYWNILALDGSNWQRVDLFDFQTDVEVCYI